MIECASPEAAARAASDFLANAIQTGLTQRGEACIALSGGSTPGPAYRLLAQAPIDWPRVRFILVDERWLPPEQDGSNEKMLRATLAPALAAGARLDGMWRGAGSPHADAEALESEAYGAPPLDAALMGMGADGHTASWFPNAPELAAALDPHGSRRVIAISAPGAAAANERLSLTLPAIVAASAIALLIAGQDKIDALARAQSGETVSPAPIAALLLQRPDLTIYGSRS